MTGKPEKIVSGRFELAYYSGEFYRLMQTDTERSVWAKRSEFVELAKEIIRHELEENSTIDNDPCSHFDNESS